MKICCEKFECIVCGKVSTIQLFFRGNGELAYGRARHYKGRINDKPKFEYHPKSIEYLQRKLNQIPKYDKSNKIGQIGHSTNIDPQKTEEGTILKNSWASSSVRIKLHPLGLSNFLLFLTVCLFILIPEF